MKHLVSYLVAAVVLFAAVQSAQAACYADYKAKQENPLRLHYGVVEVDADPCRMSGKIRRDVEKRVADGGWKVLQVQSVFGDAELEATKRDAGKFFLRY